MKMLAPVVGLGLLGALGVFLYAQRATPAVAATIPSSVAGFNVLYSVPGVINSPANALATFFQCTNNSSDTLGAAVEIYGPNGGAPVNNVAANSLGLAPGMTVLFGTGFASAFAEDSVLAPGLVQKGSARILVTAAPAAKYVMCSAFVADTVGNPPTSMTSLPIVKGLVQRGQ